MRKYETMYIIRPDLTEEKYPQVVEKYAALIQNNGGEIVKTDIWGRRRLAYEINKKSDGIYVVIDLNCKIETVKELDRQLSLNEAVLRTKVVRAAA